MLDLGKQAKVPLKVLTHELVERFLDDMIAELGNRKETEYVFKKFNEGSSVDRQIATFGETRYVKAVVDRLIS